MRRRVTIEDQGSVSKVRGWRVNELLGEAGIKPFFARGGWIVDADRVPDLLAHIERRGIAVSGGASAPPAGGNPVATSPVQSCAPRTLAPESGGEDKLDLPLWSTGDAS